MKTIKLEVRSFPLKERQLAKKWIEEHGHKLDIKTQAQYFETASIFLRKVGLDNIRTIKEK